MTRTTEEIIAAAMTLPPEAKSKLAEQLLDSLESIDQQAIDAAWVVEARRRVRELAEGKAHTIPADEVFRNLDARLKA